MSVRRGRGRWFDLMTEQDWRDLRMGGLGFACAAMLLGVYLLGGPWLVAWAVFGGILL